MKFIKRTATIFLLGLFTVGFASELSAQDDAYANAIEAFNAALEQAQAGEYENAINLYNQAMTEAEQSDNENAPQIVERVQNQLPSIYYQLSVNNYRAFQNSKTLATLEDAMSSFQEASDIASEYGDSEVQQRSSQIVTQLYYQRSLLEYQSQDFEAAITSLDNAIERNPNYATAYYQKGIVIKNQDSANLDQALAAFDQAIEVANSSGQNQMASRATNAAAAELVYRGYQASENDNLSTSIDLLSRALNYNSESADAHYRLAEVYNKQAQWNDAISHANQALELENGGTTEMAKIYFELGTALQGEGRVSEACSAFSNAAYGSFKSPAEHRMEFELECESTTR